MFSITSSNSAPEKLSKLREWFVAEWGEIDPFEGAHKGFNVPAPILALDRETLIGGLAFTSFSVPGKEEIGLWVNTLFVDPNYRGKGIGKKLIQEAKAEASRTDAETLYVYTDIPKFYQKLEWETMDTTDKNTVLKISLINE